MAPLPMTKELSQNKIDLVNKTNKKITIKHYLNMYNRPTVGNTETVNDPSIWKYSVYVRITFNRLTTKIKSATDLNCTVNELNSPNDLHKNLFERESLFLIDHISRQYEAYGGSQNFNINSEFYDFSYEDYELDKIVDQLLIMSMKDFMPKNGLFDEDSTLFNGGLYKISPLELLTYLTKINPVWNEFRNKYSDEIWTWKVLYQRFKDNNYDFAHLGASVVDFTHGNFRNAFLQSQVSKTSSINKIIKDIESLLNQYYYWPPL